MTSGVNENAADTNGAQVSASPENGGGATGADRKPGGFTSVIYVHGIGSQRRYEETSRLIDSLDRLQFNADAADASIGFLSNIEVGVEPLRESERDGTVVYVRTQYSRPPDNPDAPRATVRFHENYWAPIMADVKSPVDVLIWLFRQPLRPRQTALSPWRERQRLRRASLVSLFEPGRTLPEGVEQGDCGDLLELYHLFEGLTARREYPRGDFADFLRFVEAEEQNRPERLKRHLILSKLWRRHYFLEEARNLLVLTTMALALLLLGLGVLGGSYKLLQILADMLAAAPKTHNINVEVTWQASLTLATSLFGLLGLGKVLTDYLGDVEAWATYEETDVKHVARRKVLDQSIELFTHVLNDDRCDRVVIISHSLGTSIAQDTLLALTQRNRAVDPGDAMRARVRLDKIDQFITMGSPIDKLEYFFESYTSQSHRYKRVVEALRGDIGAPPFSDSNIPHIHWINFWDAGDPIGGPLQSPTGSALYLQRIDNVQVASVAFPDPAASHAGYFTNRDVITRLFEIIYRGRHSFWPATPGKPLPQDEYRARSIGPGAGVRGRRTWFALAIALPWLVLVGIVAAKLGVSAGDYFLVLAAAVFAVIAIGYLFSRFAGQRQPI